MSSPLATPKVLVVDDQAELRLMLQRQLNRLGYDVVEAEDGQAAMAEAERETPDLIITDINMPVMDGFALLQQLKSHTTLRDVPVIVVSGVSDTESLVRGVELGAEDHLVKPYEMTLLQARVRALLERKRMRDAEVGYLRRVAQITEAAEAVERDEYQPESLAALTRDRDPLGQLARVFDRVVLGLRTREERLRRRVRRLQSETNGVVSAERKAARSIDSPFTSGQVLAERFEVLGELGRGGMGTVYHVHDRELNESIALKALRPDVVASDPVILERLKSEIRLARRMSHRNVLRAHDLGESDGTYFITMEYVPGTTLGNLLDRHGRLSLESVLAIGAQLADALDTAHTQQIIHRDIKPANLIIDAQGVLKVMDFGLARPVSRETGHTMTGYVVGTPPYMAPEQLMGGQLDARTDLFAAGVLLYECLVGKPPFDSEDPSDLLGMINAGIYPSLSSQVPGIPESLEAIIARLLRRRPADRIQTARELADRLADIEDHGAERAAS